MCLDHQLGDYHELVRQAKRTNRMEHPRFLSNVCACVLGTVATLAKAIETIHTVEFSSNLTATHISEWIAGFVSSRAGGATIAILVVSLALTTIHMWRRQRPQSSRTSPSHSELNVTSTIEEDEDIQETRTNRLLGTKSTKRIRRKRRIIH